MPRVQIAAATAFLLATSLVGCQEDSAQEEVQLVGPNLSVGEGPVYQVPSFVDAFRSMPPEALEGRENGALAQLLARVDAGGGRELITEKFAGGARPGIYAVAGDSISARLIGEILSARALQAERNRTPIDPDRIAPYILDDGERWTEGPG